MRLLLGVLSLLLVGCGCDEVRVEPMISSADALWGGVDGFCARTPDGLVCWRSPTGSPRAVEGLVGEVRDVAFMIGQVCALDDEGLACWSELAPSALRMRAIDDVRELRSMTGWRGRFCALDGGGRVSCWRRPDEAPTVIEPEGIAHLHVSVGGDMICVETAEAVLRCHEFHDEMTPRRTLETTITPPLRRVAANTMAGELWVLDVNGLEHGRGLGGVVATNPFGNPLEATLRDIPHQRIAIAPVHEANDVQELLGHSVWMFVHDAAGIRMVEDRFGRLEERERYDFGAPPEAMLAVTEGIVFARAGGELVIRGHASGDPVRRRVRVRDPAQVVVALDEFCVRHAGGVSCGTVPE